MPKSGFVAIVGRPNVGKSTLLNALLGEKIAIISHKPQTTRKKALAIKTTKNAQVVFVDTPGVHRPRTKLGEYMNKVVSETITDVDAAILIVDATKEINENEEKIISELSSKKIPTILAINKIDLIKKEMLLPLIDKYQKLMDFVAIIPISAKLNDNVGTLWEETLKLMPEGPFYYPEDQLTDANIREICAEIVREKTLRLLEDEVPHGIMVEIEEMKEGDRLVRIFANIYCEKASHKAIIIGKNGEMLKKIGTYAREDMEKFLEKKVYLELWVKVKDDWRNKSNLLKSFGFEG